MYEDGQTSAEVVCHNAPKYYWINRQVALYMENGNGTAAKEFISILNWLYTNTNVS